MMKEFILEEQIENVINNNTKKHLMEVVSSYNNGNYRATIVVLYTAVIYDLLQKLVTLKEIYNDKGAEKILDDIKNQQKMNPKNPVWEGSLIEKIYKETKIISMVEKEELLYLKSERNYAAHPIINMDEMNGQLELKKITKETAKDMIRKAFEIVFLKDAILAKNIIKDFLFELIEFYARVKTAGLENFLNNKYFSRMTQERKDILFKSLWKFVFLIKDDECDKNREARYWGLIFLYNENKNHYKSLIKNDEDFYFNKLELETIESWSGKNSKYIDFDLIKCFKNRSRIIYFVKILEYASDLYKVLNNHAKNILKQSINHMYIKEDVVEKALYQTKDQNAELFKEQVKIKSMAVFMSEDIVHHFELIHKMIYNYEKSKNKWVEPSYYDVLNAEDLEQIFYQSEQKGCIGQFIKFLIDYCMGADTYLQAQQMFEYLKNYQNYFKVEHYYIILTKMNDNSQYYENNEKGTFIKEVEQMYLNNFNDALIKEKEEKYLYKNLYDVNKSENYNVKRILELIEERAAYYSIWNLQSLIFGLESFQNLGYLKNEKITSYSNILKVLDNKNDLNYMECYLEKFKGYFKE